MSLSKLHVPVPSMNWARRAVREVEKEEAGHRHGTEKTWNHWPSRPDPTMPEPDNGLPSINQPFVWQPALSAGKEELARFPLGFIKCSHPVVMTRVLVSCLRLFWFSE